MPIVYFETWIRLIFEKCWKTCKNERLFELTFAFEKSKKKKEEKFFGRNPKCDRDWIKVQREKGNKSPKRKGKIKVQIKIGKNKLELKKKVIPKTTM